MQIKHCAYVTRTTMLLFRWVSIVIDALVLYEELGVKLIVIPSIAFSANKVIFQLAVNAFTDYWLRKMMFHRHIEVCAVYDLETKHI